MDAPGCPTILTPQVFNPLASLSSFYTLLWLRSRILSHYRTSSSESSLLEERMRGKHPYYKECATLPRVRRSTGVVHRDVASGYVLFPTGTFNLIIYPGSTRPYNRGWACLFFLVIADRDDPACSVASTTSRMSSSSQIIAVIYSTTHADLKPAVKMS
jgi:hypothetical protein